MNDTAATKNNSNKAPRKWSLNFLRLISWRKIGLFIFRFSSIVLIFTVFSGIFYALKFEKNLQQQITLLNSQFVSLQQAVTQTQSDLTELKQATSENSQKLDNIKQQPTAENLPENIITTYLQLNNLDAAIDTITFNKPEITTSVKIINTETTLPLSAWQRFVNILSQIFNRLVIVRQIEPNDLSFMTADGQQILKQNLHAELIIAKLAVLQKQNRIYQASTQKLLAWIKQYAANNTSSEQLISELTTLQSVDLQPNQDQKI